MFVEINLAYLIASIFFLTSGCYLYLCIVTFTDNTKSTLRNDYLSSGMCLVLYSLCYGLMTIAANEMLCRFFWAVGFISANIFLNPLYHSLPIFCFGWSFCQFYVLLLIILSEWICQFFHKILLKVF